MITTHTEYSNNNFKQFDTWKFDKNSIFQPKPWTICLTELNSSQILRKANDIDKKIKQMVDKLIDNYAENLNSENKGSLRIWEESHAIKILDKFQRDPEIIQSVLHNLRVSQHALKNHASHQHPPGGTRSLYKICKIIDDLLDTYNTTSTETTNLFEFLACYNKQEDKDKLFIDHIIYPQNRTEGKKIIEIFKKWNLDKIKEMEHPKTDYYMHIADIRAAQIEFPLSLEVVNNIPRAEIEHIYHADSKQPIYQHFSIGRRLIHFEGVTYHEYFKNIIKAYYYYLAQHGQKKLINSPNSEIEIKPLNHEQEHVQENHNLAQKKELIKTEKEKIRAERAQLAHDEYVKFNSHKHFQCETFFKLCSGQMFFECLKTFKQFWDTDMKDYLLEVQPKTAMCHVEFKVLDYTIATSKKFIIKDVGTKDSLAHLALTFEITNPIENTKSTTIDIKTKFGEFFIEKETSSTFSNSLIDQLLLLIERYQTWALRRKAEHLTISSSFDIK